MSHTSFPSKILRKLNESSTRKYLELMKQFKTAEEFSKKVSRGGFGGKSPAAIVQIIDKNSRTRLDLSQVRREVEAGGSWYFLDEADVASLDPHTHGKVDPSGEEDLTKPIVVGRKGEVLDGRHRVVTAKSKGARTLPAYIPAEMFYNRLMGKSR